MIELSGQFWSIVGIIAFGIILVIVAVIALAAIIGSIIGSIEWLHNYTTKQ